MRVWWLFALAACGGSSRGPAQARTPMRRVDGTDQRPPGDTAAFADTLDGNRNRLLATYYAYLEQDGRARSPTASSAATSPSVCDLWTALDPSARGRVPAR